MGREEDGGRTERLSKSPRGKVPLWRRVGFPAASAPPLAPAPHRQRDRSKTPVCPVPTRWRSPPHSSGSPSAASAGTCRAESAPDSSQSQYTSHSTACAPRKSASGGTRGMNERFVYRHEAGVEVCRRRLHTLHPLPAMGSESSKCGLHRRAAVGSGSLQDSQSHAHSGATWESL